MKLYKRNLWENNYPEDKMQNNCAFCENDTEYLIWESAHWKIIHNKFPVLGLKQHIMAIPKIHHLNAREMSYEEFADYKNVEEFVAGFYGKNSYFTFMRESIDGRSIAHIHYHFLPGKIYYGNIEKMLLEQGFTNQLDSE